jgi:hypothetical protein
LDIITFLEQKATKYNDWELHVLELDRVPWIDTLQVINHNCNLVIFQNISKFRRFEKVHSTYIKIFAIKIKPNRHNVIACVSGSARDRLENLTLPIWWMTNSKSREEAISKLYDDLVFNVMFSVDEPREIVKNYLAELHISDDSNEALISNLQSA